MAKAAAPDALSRYLANTTKPALVSPPSQVAPLAPNTAYGELNPGTTLPASTPATPYDGPGTTGTTSDANPAGSAAAVSTTDPTQFAADWYKSFFAQYGLPADVQASILDILKQYAGDPTTAQALAQQYLRTTDWYQQTFPGFAAGQRNGLFTDETGYRGYLNQVNQTFNQYLGRHVTSDELAGYLASGYAPSHVGSLLQGQAWAGANGNDVRQLTGAFGDDGQISDGDLGTLGNEHAGIDSGRGQALDAMVTRAQQRLQSIYQGKLGTPASLALGPTGLAAPSGLGGRTTPDVGA